MNILNKGVELDHILVEVAVFSASSAINAAEAGADRIELCTGHAEGGLSPSIGSVTYVREKVNIPLHIMCRPRAGDFIYNEHEIQVIRNEISIYKDLKVDGIVIGVLNSDGNVDHPLLKNLVELARPMSVTFHRAFDISADLNKNLELLVASGVDRVLTSGGRKNVTEGRNIIRELVGQAAGRIRLIAGGGLKSSNVVDLVKTTGVREIHLSGKMLFKSPMEAVNKELQFTGNIETGDYSWYETSAEKIREVRRNLKLLKSNGII